MSRNSESRFAVLVDNGSAEVTCWVMAESDRYAQIREAVREQLPGCRYVEMAEWVVAA